MTRNGCIGVGALALLGGLSMAHAQPVTSTVHAAAGQAAPGLTDVQYELLSDPRVNGDGQIVFWAKLKGTGVTLANDGSIWSNRTGPTALVVREGDPTPGIPSTFFGAVPNPSWNNAGDIAFTAAVTLNPTAPTTTNLAIFAETAGGPLGFVEQELAITAPGFAGLSAFGFNSTAGIGYGVGNGSRMTSTRSGTLANLYLAGDAAPGASGLNLYFISAPSQNASGAVAFRASLTDKPVPTNPAPQPVGWGIFADGGTGGGPLRLVAKTGDPAPGTLPGQIFADVGLSPVMINNGAVVYWGRLTGAGITTSNDTGLWYDNGVSSSLIAREGTAVPGFPSLNYGELPTLFSLNQAGQLAFVGALAGPGSTAADNTAIFSGDAKTGALSMVLREHDQAPRFEEGTVAASFGPLSLNEAGQLAVLVGLDDPAVESENNTALYATDKMGFLYPVVHTGDIFNVDGVDETIDEIIWDSGVAEQGSTQMNADGLFILKVSFAKDKALARGAIMSFQYSCAADADASGQLDIDDFVAFQTLFAIGDLRTADFDGNGTLNIDDFVAFQTQFAIGC